MKKVKKAKKGFTLIEMIVVVAIIAVLAGIAIPQVTKQINNSKKKADIATAKTIAGAIQQALAEGEDVKGDNWTLVTSAPNEVLKNIANTNDVNQAKYNKNYKFYYKYDSSNNTVEVAVNSEQPSDSSKNLYPEVKHSDYTK